jgi:hypothetical protein
MPKFGYNDIRAITQQLEMGFRCFYHRETGELLFFPDELRYPDIDMDAWAHVIEKFSRDSSSYKEVDPITSQDSLRIMADFVEQMHGNNRLRDRLTDTLNRKHPFRNFKAIIDNSGDYRQQWFEYKDARLMELARERIERDKIDP